MTRIQIRRDTQVNWEQFNPILGDGERAYDKTNKKYKIGNGVDHWNDLQYESSGGGGHEPDTTAGLEVTSADKLAVKLNTNKFKFNNDGKIDMDMSHETWTFTLEDDTTVDKEVMLWTGTV